MDGKNSEETANEKVAGVAKTAVKAAAGNYVGAALEIVKNKQTRRAAIIASIGLVATQALVYIVLISLVISGPSLLIGSVTAAAEKIINSIVGVFDSDSPQAAEVIIGAQAATSSSDVPWQVLAATELILYDYKPAPSGKAPYKIQVAKTDKYPWGALSEDDVKDRETSGRWLVKAIIDEFGTGRGGTVSSGAINNSAGGGVGSSQFFETYGQMAKASEDEYAVPASVILAQAALESGWGQSGLATKDNNFFGVKCTSTPSEYQSGCSNYDTREVVNGASVMVNAGFRSYASPEDSFKDHGRFLAVDNSRYGPAFEADNADDFARALQAAGYATDPNYADKLIKMMEDNDLYRFNASGGKERTPTPKTYSDGSAGSPQEGSSLKDGDLAGGYLAKDLLAGAVEVEDPDGVRRLGIDDSMKDSKPIHEQAKSAYKSVLNAMPIEGMNLRVAGKIFDLAFQLSVGINPCDSAATGNIMFNEYTGQWVSNAADAKQMDTSDGIKPWANNVRNYIFRAWPQVESIGGWRPPDGYDEHSTGRAIDVMINPGGSINSALGNEIFGWVKLNAKALNLKHVIWQQSIWWPGMDMSSAGNPMEDRGSPTQNHMDHLHVFMDEGDGDYDFSVPPKPMAAATQGGTGSKPDGGRDLTDPATGQTISLDAKQVKYLNAIVDLVNSSGDIPKDSRNTAMSALAGAMWAKSRLRNLDCKDSLSGFSNDGVVECSPHDVRGVLQLTSNWGTLSELMNPDYSMRAFLGLPMLNAPNRGMLKSVSNWQSSDPGEIAQKILLDGTPQAYSQGAELLDPVLSEISGIDMKTGAVIDSAKAESTNPQSRGSSNAGLSEVCSTNKKSDSPTSFAPDQVSDKGFRAPTEGVRTSPFGSRSSPLTGAAEMHDGMDIAYPGGNPASCGKPIWAAYAGTVISAQKENGYGNHILIDHGEINGVKVITGYAHIVDGGFRVKVGDKVSAGEQIAQTGTTGWSTGCHLHFQVKENGQFVDPAGWLSGLKSIK